MCSGWVNFKATYSTFSHANRQLLLVPTQSQIAYSYAKLTTKAIRQKCWPTLHSHSQLIFFFICFLLKDLRITSTKRTCGCSNIYLELTEKPKRQFKRLTDCTEKNHCYQLPTSQFARHFCSLSTLRRRHFSLSPSLGLFFFCFGNFKLKVRYGGCCFN